MHLLGRCRSSDMIGEGSFVLRSILASNKASPLFFLGEGKTELLFLGEKYIERRRNKKEKGPKTLYVSHKERFDFVESR